MRKIIALSLAAIVLFLAVANQNKLIELYRRYYPQLESIQQTSLDTLKEIEGKIFAPPPLIKEGSRAGSELTTSGILDSTNQQRVKFGLGALQADAALNEAAKLKLNDMFNQQYFEHISPEGTSISKLAEETGYEYIIIGENLAMGNFEDNEDLVGAWMQSPGHRENILNEHFTEIGIAARSGSFEGESVWIAVQEFGAPLSLCPKPNKEQAIRINEMKSKIEIMQNNLDDQKNELDSQKFSSKEEYRQSINGYNSLVEEYNRSVNELKTLTESYNRQAEKFNSCIEFD